MTYSVLAHISSSAKLAKGQLQDAVAFIRNAIIHRDYQELGSEIHIDMYNDRMEVYSPGGMIDGRLIQQLNPLSVPSKRRNPLLADFFSRLDLMERCDSRVFAGRFELHKTQNMYNFILLDTLTGRIWQVQWSTEAKDRMILPIY